jgi:hypothetical protein
MDSESLRIRVLLFARNPISISRRNVYDIASPECQPISGPNFFVKAVIEHFRAPFEEF